MWNTPFYLLFELLFIAADMYIQLHDFAHAGFDTFMICNSLFHVLLDEEIDVLLRFVWYQDSWAVILISLVSGL